MKKLNRYLSLELLLALLFIVAFFLPWLDYGPIKTIGWKIPGLNENITKATNFIKVFSKEKESIYTGYALYAVPFLSALVILSWLMLKPRIARGILMLASMLGLALSIYMFFKLPEIGSGVYLLFGSTILGVIYTIFVPRKKKDIEEMVNPETIS